MTPEIKDPATSPSEFADKAFGVEPYDYQRDFLDSSSQRKAAICARQVGKSEMCAINAIYKAIQPSEANTVLIVAPTQRQSSELFRRVRDLIRRATNRIVGFDPKIDRETQTQIEFEDGSRIICLPAGTDGANIRGYSADMVIADEAAFMPDDIFSSVILPMLATTDGTLALASTPFGRSGFLYDEAYLDESGRWDVVQVSAKESPNVPNEFVEEQRETLTDDEFKQEILGEFVESGEKYLPTDTVMPCVRDDDPAERAALNAETAYLGVDVARAGDDRTVYIVMDEAGDVVRVESEETSKMTGVVGRIKRLDSEYDFARVNIDENAVGGGVVDFAEHDLGGKINPVAFTNESKQEMYQALKRCLEDKELSLPDHGRLVHELTALEYDFTPTGKLKVEHPPGGHDDFADAVALANLARVKTTTSGLRRRTSTGPTKGSMK